MSFNADHSHVLPRREKNTKGNQKTKPAQERQFPSAPSSGLEVIASVSRPIHSNARSRTVPNHPRFKVVTDVDSDR